MFLPIFIVLDGRQKYNIQFPWLSYLTFHGIPGAENCSHLENENEVSVSKEIDHLDEHA